MSDDTGGPVRVVQFGHGALGGAIHREALEDIADANLTAVYDLKFLDDGARAAFEDEHGVRAYPTADLVDERGYRSTADVLADEGYVIDTILSAEQPAAANIVTPHTAHVDQAAQLLENGVSAHIEKPMTTTAADGILLQELAEQNDCVLQVGYQRSVDDHTYWETLREASTDININAVYGRISQDWWDVQEDTWRANGALSGQTGSIGWGMAGDTGSHLIQGVIELVGGEPQTVSAWYETRDGTGDAPVDVNGGLLLELEQDDGDVVYAGIDIRGDIDGPVGEALQVYGDGTRLDYWRAGDTAELQRDGDTLLRDDTGADIYTDVNRAKLAQFVDAVKHDDDAAVPADYGILTTATHQASYRSAQEGGAPVDVTDHVDAARSEALGDD
jgi:predicted dehydrogenase